MKRIALVLNSNVTDKIRKKFLLLYDRIFKPNGNKLHAVDLK